MEGFPTSSSLKILGEISCYRNTTPENANQSSRVSSRNLKSSFSAEVVVLTAEKR
jgi:hypothetical protein